jgi:putative FmdB family regulatory protein
MPIYKFKCDICGVVFEKPLHMEDDKSGLMCPNGHKQVYQVYTAPHIVFKGPGFYINDSQPKPRSGSVKKNAKN